MSSRIGSLLLAASCLVPGAVLAEEAPAAAPVAVPVEPPVAPPVGPPPAERHDVLTTPEALRGNGLTEAQYASLLHDLAEQGAHAKKENTFVIGKFTTTLYGFVEADAIRDDTRSFLEVAGSGAVSRPGSNAGDLGRTIFSVRNSRLGFRLAAPEAYGMRSSAQIEFDLFANQASNPPHSAGSSEGPFFNNPGLRVRHALLKLETDVVNVWFGQWWQLAGWQNTFQPNTVAIQGVPGELYGRTAQLRLDKVIKAGPVDIEVAAAALRPPQMDSGVPDFQAGLKLSFEGLKGVQTIGQTGTDIVKAAVGVSGGVRHFRLPVDVSGAANSQGATGYLVAADVLVPVLPAAERKTWALTVLGEATLSSGYADQFTGLSGGAGVGTPPGSDATAYAKVANVDPGLVGWSSATGALETIDWRTLIVSAQLTLPPEGKLWLAGGYSNSYSDNVGHFGAAKSVWGREIWWDANLFADVTPALRFGLEFSRFTQVYGDKVQTTNDRVQLSGFFIF